MFNYVVRELGYFLRLRLLVNGGGTVRVGKEVLLIFTLLFVRFTMKLKNFVGTCALSALVLATPGLAFATQTTPTCDPAVAIANLEASDLQETSPDLYHEVLGELEMQRVAGATEVPSKYCVAETDAPAETPVDTPAETPAELKPTETLGQGDPKYTEAEEQDYKEFIYNQLADAEKDKNSEAAYLDAAEAEYGRLLAEQAKPAVEKDNVVVGGAGSASASAPTHNKLANTGAGIVLVGVVGSALAGAGLALKRKFQA